MTTALHASPLLLIAAYVLLERRQTRRAYRRRDLNDEWRSCSWNPEAKR